MVSLLLALLTVSADSHDYPLAAAIVINREVVVVDVHAKTAAPIEIGNIEPEEADLDRTKGFVAFNGKAPGAKRSKVFLYERTSKRLRTIESGMWHGDARFPRFAPTGEWLYFSAAIRDEVGSAQNPGQVFRLRMSDGSVEAVETDEHLCHFSPVELQKNTVAHVETPCMMGFDLRLTNMTTKKTTEVASLRTPASELATSLDRKALLYTSPTTTGLGLYTVRDGAKEGKLLTTLSVDSNRIQPRFVCPKDVVFYNKGAIWLLDSKSGEKTMLLAYPVAADGGAE